MVWNYDLNKPDQELVWDLRQTYAEIVGEVLKRVAECRVKKDYAAWYDSLRDLFIEINQKLKDKERVEYKDKLKKTLQTLNDHSGAYNKKDSTPDKVNKVYLALVDMELWLKQKMEEHRMFGAKEEPELL